MYYIHSHVLYAKDTPYYTYTHTYIMPRILPTIHILRHTICKEYSLLYYIHCVDHLIYFILENIPTPRQQCKLCSFQVLAGCLTYFVCYMFCNSSMQSRIFTHTLYQGYYIHPHTHYIKGTPYYIHSHIHYTKATPYYIHSHIHYTKATPYYIHSHIHYTKDTPYYIHSHIYYAKDTPYYIHSYIHYTKDTPYYIHYTKDTTYLYIYIIPRILYTLT